MLIASVVVLAQLDTLGGKAAGVLAQVVAGLLGIAVAWVTVVVVWNLLKSMASNPDFGKLLGLVAVGLFAVFLAGATPDALDAAYAYGQSFLDGGP